MSDRLVKIMLIDPDPIFRTGLRVVLGNFNLKVIAEAENSVVALEILAELFGKITASTTVVPSLPVDLVILELSDLTSLQLLCWQIKTQYPNLPILLFCNWQEPSQLAAAKAIGVEGYCPKGISIATLVTVINQITAGELYWFGGTPTSQVYSNSIAGERASLPIGIFSILRQRWRKSGLQQIDRTLVAVRSNLEVPGIPLLKRAFLAGQQRELLAARWLVNHLLPPVAKSRYVVESVSTNLAIAQSQENSQISFKIPLGLFKSTLTKLQFSLENLTSTPLEIDILREDKKRQLLYLVLRKIENVLNQLRSSQVQIHQLAELCPVILHDLWQGVTIDFLGRYSTVQVKGQNLEVVKLLQHDLVVQTEVLKKVPLVKELFEYLLFQTPLVIDNISYSFNSPEAIERGELILNNLLVQVANAVVQPLLNYLADVEAIKQNFYARHLISTRDLERFRNNLSWKYRVEIYINEPKEIFESRYNLFVFTSSGIAQISVYAPRAQELEQLSGIPLAVTLILEFRDAIAPRLQSIVAFLGIGIVYVLTQVIGKALGLIGRGILQGLGGSFSDTRNKKL